MTMPYILKPGDLVRTPSGRTAQVREVLPHNERRVVFVDGPREDADFRASVLTLVRPATPRPWLIRTLP